MRIVEMFEGIQGEGRYVGHPALFIRLEGCNLNCPWCDTKYAMNLKEGDYKNIDVRELIGKIMMQPLDMIVWTGGEPMMQYDEIAWVLKTLERRGVNIINCLETNGLLALQSMCIDAHKLFDYICFSPKDKKTAEDLSKLAEITIGVPYDIKIVTDLDKIGTDLISCATMLMPLTTFDKKKDEEIKKKVWNYCIKANIKYSPRLHVDVWGKKRGV